MKNKANEKIRESPGLSGLFFAQNVLGALCFCLQPPGRDALRASGGCFEFYRAVRLPFEKY
jgi:hypothetical protein